MTTPMHAKIVQFIELAGCTVKKALDAVGQKKKDDASIEAYTNSSIKKMAEEHLIDAGEEKRARELLSTHSGALSLLGNALDKIAELSSKYKEAQKSNRELTKRAASNLGRGVDNVGDGDLGYDSINDPVVGRRTSQKKASDVALAKGLGLVI